MKIWVPCSSLLAGLAVLAWGAACSSPAERGFEAETDGSAPPSLPETDSGGSDANPSDPDAAPPKPIEVACDAGPCFVTLSGNGGRHLCGLLKDETVRCWGRDAWDEDTGFGALGRGVRASALEGATPATVAGLTGVTQLSVGPNFGSCARTSNGRVYCWGKNDVGQLGQPPSTSGISEATPIDELPPVDEVQVGFAMGCAIGSSDQALYCWGTNAEGVYTPPQVMTAFPPPIKQLAIGTKEEADAIIVLLDKGILAATGRNLPSPDSYLATDPVTRSGVVRIAPFAYATSDGLFRRWIPGEEGIYVPSMTPVRDVKLSGAPASVAQRSPWAAAQGGVLTNTGRLFRWGANASGALGQDPAATEGAFYPVEVKQVEFRVISFAMTVGSTCASLTNGEVKCWGDNTFGELGRGSTDLESHPEPSPISSP